ncbi:MAG: long-chain fatty acid--CoA ligase [Rhodospirillaceae bacterium BRH_c57]|nr:MAG: long-chain fatty acid--CoA ligase [Rhodospirillaceae bacterium BRH_c57]
MSLPTPATVPLSRLHQIFAQWVVHRPDAPALSDGMRTLTYADLDRAVKGTADRLRALGVRPGDRVVLVAENCVALCVSVLAVSTLDAWSATVNARVSTREIATFLDHSGARRALYFDQVSPEAGTHADHAGAVSQDFPLIGSVRIGPLVETDPEPVYSAAEDQVAALVYTSGTTGAAKAVMLTHRNLMFVAENSLRMRRLVPEDVVYGVLPLSHVYGISSLLSATLLSGAHLILAPRFRVEDMACSLAEDAVSVLHGVPAMYARLVDWAERQPEAFRTPALRVAQAGGSPLTASVKAGFERLFGIPLQNGYGMTETSPSICQTRLDAPRSDCSVGPPIPGIEVMLHDATTPEGAGPEESVGELCVRGPNVMKGYYRSEEATRSAFLRDGWLRTGDLARIAGDGAVTIVGRAKEMIIRSGFNVYPVEVEQALNAYPDVIQSAVVGREIDGNEEVIAFIEAVDGDTISMDALNAHLRENLSPYKVPSRIVVVPHLPAAPTGKILKGELRRLASDLNAPE